MGGFPASPASQPGVGIPDMGGAFRVGGVPSRYCVSLWSDWFGAGGSVDISAFGQRVCVCVECECESKWPLGASPREPCTYLLPPLPPLSASVFGALSQSPVLPPPSPATAYGGK